MKVTGKCILWGATALLVAGQAAAQDRMQGSGIRISKDRADVTTTTTTTTQFAPGPSTLVTEVVLPAFDINAYTDVSEANMLALLLSGDSLEIEISRLAQSKGTDQRVRDFANMLVNDHSAHLSRTLAIIPNEGITPVVWSNDLEGQRMRAMLAWLSNAPAGSTWDAAFLRFQAAHHQNVIDILNRNIKNAHDDDFEKLLDDTLESLARHRDMARSHSTALGISLQ